MRKINEIIIHCSATEAGADFSAKDIDSWHKARGFSQIGYHYVVRLDGSIEPGRPEHLVGAHCLGHNAHSIGICYIGGLLNGKPFDTRTIKQKAALKILVERMKRKYPDAKVLGHHDLNPFKACPCFSPIPEYIFYLLAILLMLLTACRSPKTMTKQNIVTDSVSLSMKDSISKNVTFTFDQLELFTDSLDTNLLQCCNVACNKSPHNTWWETECHTDTNCLTRFHPSQANKTNKKQIH